MPAEDYEQDYFDPYNPESSEHDFLTALYGAAWGLGSIPFMFIFMFLMCGLIPAIWATAVLLTIYIVFIFIELRT